MSYFYIASPYTHPDMKVQDQRYEKVVDFTSYLISQFEMHVYSPIVHSHPLCKTRWELQSSFDFWLEMDRTMLVPAKGLIVLQVPGWKESVGVSMEIDMAVKFGKPILHSRAQFPEYEHD